MYELNSVSNPDFTLVIKLIDYGMYYLQLANDILLFQIF